MTIQQILDLPTADIYAMTDAQLELALGELIPQSREPDKENFQKVKTNNLLAKAQALLAAADAQAKPK